MNNKFKLQKLGYAWVIGKGNDIGAMFDSFDAAVKALRIFLS